jgi:hypothetical protein
MKNRLITAAIGSVLLPSLALAHPGHDDGHELTWDFSHLAAHPAATLLCLAVMMTGAWAVWLLVRRATVTQEYVKESDASPLETRDKR